MAILRIRGDVPEGEQFDVMFRMGKPDTSILLPSDLTATGFRARAYDISRETADVLVHDSGAVDPATAIPGDASIDYVNANLQTDGRWTADSVGYNVIFSFDQASFSPTVPAGHTLRIEITLTTTLFGTKTGVAILNVISRTH